MECNRLKTGASSRVARSWLGLLAGLVLAGTAQAATYILPKGDVVGQVQYATATGKESLAEIARRYDVGINAIAAANPHLDPKQPAAGARIIIPGRHILPPGPRQGIVINLAEMKLYYYSTPPAPPSPIVLTKVEGSTAPETANATAPAAGTAAITTEPKEAEAEAPAEAPIIIPAPEPDVVGPLLVSIYPISIGGEARSMPLGSYTVEQRLSQPSWTVPAAVRAEQPKLPDVLPPGPNNPLGAFAINLDRGGYMIHGTNRPGTIGMRVSRGGISMYPEDIELLIQRLATGTSVRVINESLKHGYKNGALYLEFHKPAAVQGELNHAALVNWMSRIVTTPMDVAAWQRVRLVAEGSHGIAMPVMQVRPKPRPDYGWWLQLTSYKTAQSAHALINKIEVMEVPVTIKGCYDKLPCKVVAGPFKDKLYIEELRKKIKWVAGVKASVVPYQEENDFLLPDLSQKVASNP